MMDCKKALLQAEGDQEAAKALIAEEVLARKLTASNGAVV